MSSEAVDNQQTSLSPPQKKRKLHSNGNGEMPVQDDSKPGTAGPAAIDEGLYSRQL